MGAADGRYGRLVFQPRVTLAINVALATERPLLIAGEPGSGKTRLAAAVAEVLDWQFYPKTVTLADTSDGSALDLRVMNFHTESL